MRIYCYFFMCFFLFSHVVFALSPYQVREYTDEYLQKNTLERVCKNEDWRGIQTYDVSDTHHLFYQKVDTYDNALAAIYYMTTQQPELAIAILETYEKAMVSQGYMAKHLVRENRVMNFKGLPARFDFKNEGCPQIPPEQNSSAIDAGNIAFLGLAFIKFYSLHQEVYPDISKKYQKIALDLWFFLHQRHRCPQDEGYFARQGVGQQYVSTEHNIDIYALTSLLLKFDCPLEDTYALQISRDISGDFVSRQFHETKKTYSAGQSQCSYASSQVNQYTPADTQSWRYLSLAESSSTESSIQEVRSDRSMRELLSPRFLVHDTLKHPQGCALDRYFVKGIDAVSCSHFSSVDLYYGIRFTDWGQGLQIENTAAALMAGDFYQARKPGRQHRYSASRERMVRTLEDLFMIQKGQGLPASFREEASYYVDPITHKTVEIMNTGIAWSYYKVPHLASTVWSALALLFHAHHNPHYNPYGSAMTESFHR